MIRDIEKLMPQAQDACRLFLYLCGKKGLPVKITETLRTKERQMELYAKGRTTSGKIVTWTKNSRHQSGLAWDICKNVKGCEYTDTEFFGSCGKIARELGITWGGDWKKRDLPHFEVTESWEAKNMEELLKELAEIKSRLKTYRYTQDVPSWARPTVQKLLDKGIYKGSAEDDLNLTEDVMRTLVILDRGGVFDR